MEKFNKSKNCFIILLFFMFSFFTFILNVNASTRATIRTNDGYGVLLRKTASTSSSSLADVPEYAVVTILDTNAGSGNGCDAKWYKIDYKNKTGYVCNKYIVSTSSTTTSVVAGGAYEETLKTAKFPESYWPYLKYLHQKYPNWQFEALTVNTNFETMANEQYTLGKNLIQSPPDGWKRLDTYLYNENRFSTNFSGGGSTWFAPSKEVIKYYLDPRNFLNEYDIFMFEKLSFNATFQTRAGVVSLLSNTFMKDKTSDGQNDTYADIFMEAANNSEINTSPYFLAARIIQEVGTSRSSAVSGTVEGYTGYYNFYNIDATGSSDGMTNVKNGLARAVKEDWNTEKKAILGGAKIIASGYINAGQDTLYNQKFDMTNFWHQYQQNIEAPIHERQNMRKIYRANSFLPSSFVFRIPVYSNMPNTTVEVPNPGSPINALKELKVDNKIIDGFNKDKKEYTIYISGSTVSINLSATPYVNSATVSGAGNITVGNGTTKKEIKVTAENGSINTYTLNIVKDSNEQPAEPTVNDIMPKIGVKYNDTYISGIKIGTDVSTLVNNIKKQNANASVVIKDSNGSAKTTGKFGTGYTVAITSGGTNKTYTVVIYGDTNGDGEVTIFDLLRVQKIILNSTTLSGSYKTAADVNKDGKVTIFDLLQVQKDILGSSKITQ